MIRQIAADPVNADTPDTIGAEDPLGSFCSSDPAGLYIFYK